MRPDEQADLLVDDARCVASGGSSGLLQSYNAEERAAWDRYAAAYVAFGGTEFAARPGQAAKIADALLAERRKRFPRPR